MKHPRSYWSTTIGRKQIVALTGLGLTLFVFAHMAGNLLMFVSPQKYNEYGHALTSNPLIYAAEAGLLAAVAGHMLLALYLAVKNFAARPVRYHLSSQGEKRTDWVTKSMWLQGLLVIVFIVLHLLTFKFGPYYGVNYGSGEIRDLFRLVAEAFQDPLYVVWYVVALLVLGFHLSHGVQSLVQTLGLHHPKYQGLIKVVSWGVAGAVTFGFLSQPIFIFFFYEG